MNEEIDIQVSFTPHPGDNQKEPYFWIILKGNDTKRNAGHGWEESPQKAWEKANKYYEKHVK